MKTKKVKKKVLNIPRTLVFVLFIYIIVSIGYYIYEKPVSHYEITGNSFLSDNDVIRYLNLQDYPSFISINVSKLTSTLKSDPLISDAKVSYGWGFTIKINITENQPMFIVKSTGKVCLADGTIVNYDDTFKTLPTLLNETPSTQMTLLANNLAKVDKGILYLVSEIEYNLSYNSNKEMIDENRFLLSMSDKNQVFITAKRADNLNYYLDVIANNRISTNGTLFLDGDSNNFTFKFASGTTTTTPTT